ncbi:MAG: NAD-binding protein, partial [Deltaproteobacteria bacterium]|nr:NAD-binding protein [Deltaproteobacteria bacterium]
MPQPASSPAGNGKMAPSSSGLPILVAGLGHVGVAVVHRLHALGLPVRALMTPAEVARHGVELHTLGVDVMAASAMLDSDLARLDFAAIAAVVLAADNDSGNVDACLLIRRQSPDVPVLVRVSDPTLVRFLRMSVPHVEPYSMGSVIAPVAADLALQMLSQPRSSPHAVRPKPAWLRARAWLWGIVGAAGLGNVAAALAIAQAQGGHSKVVLGPLGVLASLLTGMHIAGLDAILRTNQVAALALTVAVLDRVAMVAGVALLIDWLVPLRLGTAAPATPVSLRDHVVILGAGSIGSRVAELLHQRNLKVVVIERDMHHKNVQRLRSLGMAVVVGDATVDETLNLASAWSAGAVLALTNSDAVNLHVGLLMSDRKIGVPTLVRLLSPELNDHAAKASDIAPLSPVAETASYLCRAVERLRGERAKTRDGSATTAADPVNRPTGRYAGVEFDGRITDPHLRSARSPSSPRLPSGSER